MKISRSNLQIQIKKLDPRETPIPKDQYELSTCIQNRYMAEGILSVINSGGYKKWLTFIIHQILSPRIKQLRQGQAASA